MVVIFKRGYWIVRKPNGKRWKFATEEEAKAFAGLEDEGQPELWSFSNEDTGESSSWVESSNIIQK